MPSQIISEQHNQLANHKVALGVMAIFIAEFVSLLFANAKNIAQPGIVAEFNGMAEAPILDLQVLFNRTFATAAVAGLHSYYGAVAIQVCLTIFMQQVMEVSPAISGTMWIPLGE